MKQINPYRFKQLGLTIKHKGAVVKVKSKYDNDKTINKPYGSN